MAAAWFPIVALVAPSPASAAGAPLSCDGSTIYSAQRGSTGSTASDGAIYALSTSSVGSASVTNTLLTTIPSGGYVNAIGITKGGTALYGVNQSTLVAGQTLVYRYDAVAQTWAQFAGTGGPIGATYQAGAVDPANSIYYYVEYSAGTATTPAMGTLFGFNATTNTAIPGIIATFALPTGISAAGVNGDIAFDSAGDLYVLTSNSTISAIGVITGPIPATGSGTGVVLPDTVLTTFPATVSYVGIAFDNAGNLYTESGGVGTSAITKFNPSTGAVVAGPTPISSDNNAQAFMQTDLAACSLNPTLALQKNIVSRYAPGDQFGLSITGGGISGGNTATTTGSSTGLQTNAVAGPVIAHSGTTYTLAETAASGNLANYTTTYSCIDTANGNAPVASGTGQSFNLPIPATTVISPNVVCTFTNTPVTTSITLKKTVAETALSLGETLHYSFLVTNTGSVTLAPVTIAETTFTGSGTPPSISCPAGASSLAPAGSVTCTATYTVTQADVDAGQVENTATATGVSPADEPIISPPSSTAVPALPAPSITVVKSVSPGSFSSAGTTLNYSFLATNTGNVTLTSVQVVDTDLPGLSAITCPHPALAPGANETCTATYVTTQADVDAGLVTNAATANGLPPGSDTPVVSAPSTATVPAVQTPGITVVKSALPSSFNAAGQTITYHFAVTNTGNVTLTGIGVTDTDLPGLSAITCPQPSLAPGTSQDCTATYLTTQADVDAGSVTNTATAHGLPPGSITPVVSAPSAATATAVQSPLVMVVKSVSPSTFSGPGQTITYHFAVTNTGNVTLTGIGATDTDLPGLSAIICPQPSLAPGASEICTATYLTTQANVDAGSVTNTATAHGLPPGQTTPAVSAPSTATVPAVESPGITLVKSASPSTFTAAGQTITYHFAVTNTGNDTLTGIGVTDTDLPGLSAITCPQPSLAPGTSEDCTAAYVTTQADVDAGAVTNTATAHGLPPASTTPLVSAPSTATAPAVQSPLVMVVKSTSPSSFSAPGQTITYHFAVTNTGNVTLTGIGVTDTDLPGLSAITCPQPSLAPGATENCTATYLTTQANVDAGSVTNTATAHGLPPGQTTPVVSAPSTTTVPAVESPGITLVKSASPSTFTAAGQTITYHFAVTNTGNDTLTGIGVTDTDLPGLSAITCPDPVLASVASEDCTAAYVTTQADVDAGAVTNTATAHGLPPGPSPLLVSAPSTATVPAVQTPGITLVKSASPSTFSKPGQTISYRFAVTNIGDDTLTGVEVTDKGLPGLSAIACPQPSLATGASEDCTATYLTTQANVNAGAVTNTATAYGLPPGSDTPVVSPSSTATVPAVQTPGITLVKSASPSTFSRPGQTITYHFAVTNTGNVTLTGIGVSDTDLPGLSAITCPGPMLTPGAGETCTATYLTTQADVDAGAVTNTATAHGLPPGSTTPAVSAPSKTTVRALPPMVPVTG